jgi:hypothetical protein
MKRVIPALACLAACEPSPENGAGPHLPVSLPELPITGVHYAETVWATVHRDSSNSDYVPLRPGAAVEVAWTALDGAGLLVGPIFGPEGNIYVPSGRGPGSTCPGSAVPPPRIRRPDSGRGA